jgi:hypothetical protein
MVQLLSLAERCSGLTTARVPVAHRPGQRPELYVAGSPRPDGQRGLSAVSPTTHRTLIVSDALHDSGTSDEPRLLEQLIASAGQRITGQALLTATAPRYSGSDRCAPLRSPEAAEAQTYTHGQQAEPSETNAER